MTKPINITLFQTNLLQIINSHPKQHISYFQFFIIMQQSNIVFASASQAQKYQIFFRQNPIIHKQILLTILQLKSIQIRNNQPFYIVKLPHQHYDNLHKPKKCFDFWRSIMIDKYGSQLRWFQSLTLDKNATSIKLTFLKERLFKILKNSLHCQLICIDNICFQFSKTNKNQIQWDTFMNVIRLSKKYQLYKTHNYLNINSRKMSKKNTLKNKISISQQMKAKNSSIQKMKALSNVSFQLSTQNNGFKKNYNSATTTNTYLNSAQNKRSAFKHNKALTQLSSDDSKQKLKRLLSQNNQQKSSYKFFDSNRNQNKFSNYDTPVDANLISEVSQIKVHIRIPPKKRTQRLTQGEKDSNLNNKNIKFFGKPKYFKSTYRQIKVINQNSYQNNLNQPKQKA